MKTPLYRQVSAGLLMFTLCAIAVVAAQTESKSHAPAAPSGKPDATVSLRIDRERLAGLKSLASVVITFMDLPVSAELRFDDSAKPVAESPDAGETPASNR
jgi:hypothetical protein